MVDIPGMQAMLTCPRCHMPHLPGAENLRISFAAGGVTLGCGYCGYSATLTVRDVSVKLIPVY